MAEFYHNHGPTEVEVHMSAFETPGEPSLTSQHAGDFRYR